MSDDRVISARITRAGMRALFSATNTGVDLKLSHIAVGTGQGVGYIPTGNETALRTEFQRKPIGGGDYLTDFEILVQAMLDGPSQGWVHEVGIFDEAGVLFAIWSEPNGSLVYKTAGVPVIIALTLAVSEIPPNSLTIIAGGANVNIIIAEPFADMSAEILRLQRRAVQSENARLIPIIQNTWR
jgi:Phage tail-collar fibre protein